MFPLHPRLANQGACVALLILSCACAAQQNTATPLPDAPSTEATQKQKTKEIPSKEDQLKAGVPKDELQTKRVLGVMPNFRSVSPGEIVPPATVKQKFVTSTLDNFDYSALFFSGVIALDAFVAKETPEFHQGFGGYTRYYWHTVADQGVQNYCVEFIVPVIAHQDSRYYAMGRSGGGILRRAGYSLSRGFVTRSNTGNQVFNISEIGGSALAVTISTFYYPSPERTVTNGIRNYAQDVGYDSVTFSSMSFGPTSPTCSCARRTRRSSSPRSLPIC